MVKIRLARWKAGCGANKRCEEATDYTARPLPSEVGATPGLAAERSARA
ncbi:hypothetical protein BSIN_3948 [Burkholderia singularis]|uniref:Uncharacterized protein n=1 Tax=Burkholderia singularis TaxID=1503053 RepID=A0A238H7A0_9BURK|nr:hypothetical protein BSIN_3948 [Burkholderia singularis]